MCCNREIASYIKKNELSFCVPLQWTALHSSPDCLRAKHVAMKTLLIISNDSYDCEAESYLLFVYFDSYDSETKPFRRSLSLLSSQMIVHPYTWPLVKGTGCDDTSPKPDLTRNIGSNLVWGKCVSKQMNSWEQNASTAKEGVFFDE